MKEATGEVSMTMVTIVAIAVIGGILVMLWPRITNMINNMFGGQENCQYGTFDPATGTCKIN